MSQYVSRIYIEVKEQADWQKLSDLNVAQYGLWDNLFDEVENKFFYLDGDWDCREGQLFNLILEITLRIPDCIIFADTNNIEVNAYNHIVYYLGDRIKTKYLEGTMQNETSLQDPYDWFKLHKIRLGKNQKSYLQLFGFSAD